MSSKQRPERADCKPVVAGGTPALDSTIKMKTCKDCKLELDESMFGIRSDNGRPKTYCRKCDNDRFKSWRSRNKEYQTKRSSDWIKNVRIPRLKKFINKIKSNPCTDCGVKYSPWVMEFDHLDRYKKFRNVSKMVANGMSEKRILEEISKCELVCANCHREREYKRFQMGDRC